jgi:hypothetical protein
MPQHDGSTAEVLVLTFKEGALSALAHDLKLKVTALSVSRTVDSASATFDATSLRVVTAMRNGAEAPNALPGFARAEIEKNIIADVLEARRYPRISFETTRVTATEVEGRLTLKGVTRPLRGTRTDRDHRLIAEFRFDQRTFGVTPYSALLGALRISPEIVVIVSLPAEPDPR